MIDDSVQYNSTHIRITQSWNSRDLELLDMPRLTAAIAVVRSAHILLVHVDAHVPEVLETVVHRHPLRGLALACKDEENRQRTSQT
jgi:hypothetical protein